MAELPVDRWAELDRLEPGAVMDALFAEWDDDRGRPPADVRVWASRELDRVFAELAALGRAHRSG